MSDHDDEDDRCDDRREFEEEQAAAEAAAYVPFGGDYVAWLGAVQDARVPDGALDLLVPDLDGRWPEPRLLWQTRVWHGRDRSTVPVDDLDEDGAERLLCEVEGLAGLLHSVAASDEILMTSTGLRRSLAAAGVALIAECDPMTWLESTLLVRSLRRRAG